jgi:hypothetical protein
VGPEGALPMCAPGFMVHILTRNFLEVNLILSSDLRLGLPNILLTCFATRSLCMFLRPHALKRQLPSINVGNIRLQDSDCLINDYFLKQR